MVVVIDQNAHESSIMRIAFQISHLTALLAVLLVPLQVLVPLLTFFPIKVGCISYAALSSILLDC